MKRNFSVNTFGMEISIKHKTCILMVALMACLIMVAPNYNYSFISYVRADSDVSFYVLSKNKEIPRFCTQIDVGSGAIVKCKGGVAVDVAKTLDTITGISFTFSGGDKEIDEFLRSVDAEIVKSESIGSISSYFAYSNKFRNVVRVDDSFVNIQVVRNKDFITIGSPIILGEY